MLVAALEIEIETYIQSHLERIDHSGHRLVVRNGTSPARSIKTGAGSLDVEQARVNEVNDRRVDPVTGNAKSFRQQFFRLGHVAPRRSMTCCRSCICMACQHQIFCRHSNSFVSPRLDSHHQQSPGSPPNGNKTTKRSTTNRSPGNSLCTYGLTVSTSGSVSPKNGCVCSCSWASQSKTQKN